MTAVETAKLTHAVLAMLEAQTKDTGEAMNVLKTALTACSPFHFFGANKRVL